MKRRTGPVGGRPGGADLAIGLSSPDLGRRYLDQRDRAVWRRWVEHGGRHVYCSTSQAHPDVPRDPDGRAA